MPGTVEAFDYLQRPAEWPPEGVCALFGDDRFLKQLVRRQIAAALFGPRQDEALVSVYPGDLCQWRDVHDELSTLSLFGAGEKRLAIVEDADKFVTAHRPQLEDYAAAPSRASVLILDVETWAANTRLYKQVDKTGLQIRCKPPMVKKGRDELPDEAKIAKWLVPWAASRHEVKLAKGAVEALLELVGPEIGMLDQAIAKLALYAADPAARVATPEMVRDIVGGWRAKSAFELIDAAADGNAADALLRLDRLLQSGDHPIALLAAMSWSLRRFASAARFFARMERQGSKPSLRQALLDAGFKDWPAGSLAANEERLKQIGRHRAGRIHRWLLEADLALKGSHSPDDRSRMMLEQLIFRLGKQQPAAKTLGSV